MFDGDSAIWWLLFTGLALALAAEIYLRSPNQKIRRHQYCRYCGKVMVLKYHFMFDGKMRTYLQCSVAEYANSSEETRKHDYVHLKEGNPPRNYDPTTGQRRREN